ncbi:MAG: methionyl-tRNA synthetase [Alphaproteobacteria bacterium]|jgi:methionyl-tRNA synthetase|nr:methionyl-tRNA synthetase [Alphaproteobacteria bacterium]
MPRKVVITAPPPTPNGDLHVGHLAGPYIAADVFARYVRSRGGDVAFATYSDDNQSYVETTAARLGTSPRELCTKFAGEIAKTLELAAIQIDAFPAADEEHNEFARAFVEELYSRGALKVKEKEFFFSPDLDAYLFEGFLSGLCPECLAETKAGICETCGHPNNYTEVLCPQSALMPDARLVRRQVKIVVLELEPYREQIRKFFEGKWSGWRPHILRLVNECLEKPLPDFPITYPHSWGIPAPFPETPGQVLNVWIETLTGLMKCTTDVARKRGTATKVDEIWRRENEWELVQFFGYDNSYFYVLPLLALSMACGDRYIFPSTLLINEFYELENHKFSTSKDHVIWARDLLQRYRSDYVRFYLALSGPAYQKANFTEAELRKIVPAKLTEPWARMVGSLNRLMSHAGFVRGASYRPTLVGSRHMTTLKRRFERFYEVNTLDLKAAAENTTQVLEAIRRRADLLTEALDQPNRLVNPREAIDLWGLLWTLAIVVGPLMPAFSSRLRAILQVPVADQWPPSNPDAWSIRPTSIAGDLLPNLDATAASIGQDSGRLKNRVNEHFL